MSWPFNGTPCMCACRPPTRQTQGTTNNNEPPSPFPSMAPGHTSTRIYTPSPPHPRPPHRRPRYNCHNTEYRKIIIGICRYIPGTYHTSGIYFNTPIFGHESSRCSVQGAGKGEDHVHYLCFDHEEFGSTRAQTLPLAHVRARAPRMQSRAKCAREPPFRARLVRLRVIVRKERARGETHRQRHRTDTMTASSAHVAA